MNKLSSLIKKYQTIRNIKRNQLAKELGYSNINKALRRLDAFANDPTIDSDFSIKLIQLLSIPLNEYELAIKQDQLFAQEQLIKSFTPSLCNILSGRSIPLTGVGLASYLRLPKNVSEMSFDDEMNAIFTAYKQDQLNKFKDRNEFALTLLNASKGMLLIDDDALINESDNVDEDYTQLLKKREEDIAQGEERYWAFGNGYRYYRTFFETLHFDKFGKLVKTTQPTNQGITINGKDVLPLLN